MERYALQRQIGKGAYCTVYQGYSFSSQMPVAIKHIQYPQQKQTQRLVTEIDILRRLQPHPNIIQLHQVVTTPNDEAYLVFELADMTLYEYYRARGQQGALQEGEIISILLQIVLGLEAVHSKRLMHRDIKPENAVINLRTGLVKLIDFGFSKRDDAQDLTGYTSTRWYRAPELLLGLRYSSPVDVYALGCLMLELYNGREVIRGRNDVDQLAQIVRLMGPIYDWSEGTQRMKVMGIQNLQHSEIQPQIFKHIERMSAQGKDLFFKMMAYDPNKRIQIKDMLAHPYFHGASLPLEVSKFLLKNSLKCVKNLKYFTEEQTDRTHASHERPTLIFLAQPLPAKLPSIQPSQTSNSLNQYTEHQCITEEDRNNLPRSTTKSCMKIGNRLKTMNDVVPTEINQSDTKPKKISMKRYSLKSLNLFKIKYG